MIRGRLWSPSTRRRPEPATTKITYSIRYNHPLIETQTYVYDWSVAAFESEIADARTFGFLKDVQALWAKGLGKGGSLENTVVLSEGGVLNESGLRFQPHHFHRPIKRCEGKPQRLLAAGYFSTKPSHRSAHD